MTLRQVYDKHFTARFPDRSEQKNEFQSVRKEGLTWYTNDSKVIKAIAAGCKVMAQGGSLATALGNIPQSFRQKWASSVDNLDTKYRNIYIASNSKEAIKTLDNFQMNSKLYLYFHQSLAKLAEPNRVQLIWVPGHRDIETVLVRSSLKHFSTDCQGSCQSLNKDTMKKRVLNRNDTGKGIPARIHCQNNKGTAGSKLKPNTVGDRTTYSYLIGHFLKM
jgi:hypothetical protein